MESIGKQPLSINLWAFKTDFNVLPTEERFKDPDDVNIELIIGNTNIDTRVMMSDKDGKNYEMKAEDVDTSWFEAPTDQIDVVPDFLDLDDDQEKVVRCVTEDLVCERARRRVAELEDDTEGLTTSVVAMRHNRRQKQKELVESLGKHNKGMRHPSD
ncbi:RNA polymerase [Staphylococcus phage vB_SauH_DELF3]|nr:RNA polymerase [Staphylococcus phage vB_SauH_DELF3]